jgi:hypothetical protein
MTFWRSGVRTVAIYAPQLCIFAQADTVEGFSEIPKGFTFSLFTKQIHV